MVTPLNKQDREQKREYAKMRRQQQIETQKSLDEEKAKEEATKRQQEQDLKNIDARRQNKPTEKEIAQQHKKGVPMSTGSSLMEGGEGAQSQKQKEADQARSLKQEKKKQPGEAGSQAQDEKNVTPETQDQQPEKSATQGQESDTPKNQQYAGGESSKGSGSSKDSKSGGGSKHERTQQAIEKQKKENEKHKAKKREAGKKTLEAKKQGKHFKRSLNHARYKSSQKKLRRGQKQLGKLEKTSEIQDATSALLRHSWYNLIDSWGLTLFYIGFHFVMAYFSPLSNLFCDFGEEWPIVKRAKKISKRSGEMLSKPLEIVESSCCLASCGIITLVIGVILIIIALFGRAWFDPAWAVQELFWPIVLTLLGRDAL